MSTHQLGGGTRRGMCVSIDSLHSDCLFITIMRQSNGGGNYNGNIGISIKSV